ncbi:MAG: hypothetical protein ACRD2E_07925 [Terriglobales bacterium]
MRLATLLTVLVTLAWPLGGASPKNRAPTRSTSLTLGEAEILVYLTPAAAAVRSSPECDVVWELQRFTRPFWVFWVLDSCAGRNQSPTVGYYAVNNRTAQVWDAGLTHLVSSRELDRVEEILRNAHHVGRAVLAKYGRLRPSP